MRIARSPYLCIQLTSVRRRLRAFEYLLYPSKSIQTDGIKAGLLTSFGFGQVGGQALIVHPSLLIGALEPAQFEAYKKLNDQRKKWSYRRFNDVSLTALLAHESC